MRPHLRFRSAVLAALVLALGCGGGSDPGGDRAPSDFWIAVETAPPFTLIAGGELAISVRVHAPAGEATPALDLWVADLPPGVRARTTGIAEGEPGGTIWLQADDHAPAARDAEVTLFAAGGGLQRGTTLLLTVVGYQPPACDPTYGLAGLATAAVGERAALRDLIVLGDGSLLAVGGFTIGDGGWVAGWSADGLRATHLGPAGLATFEDFSPQAVTVGPSGEILLGGKTRWTDQAALALLREGTLDPEFGLVPLTTAGGDVRALATFGPTVAASVATWQGHVLTRVDLPDADVVPPAADGPPPEFARFAPDGSLLGMFESGLIRFDARGRWDTGFAGDGFLVLPGAVAVVQPLARGDGVLVGGSVPTEDRKISAYVARVVGDELDPAFDELRWRRVDSNIARVVELVLLDDGAAALAYEGPANLLELVLFDEAGGVRTDLGDEGVITLPFASRLARMATDSAANLFVAAADLDGVVAVCRVRR